MLLDAWAVDDGGYLPVKGIDVLKPGVDFQPVVPCPAQPSDGPFRYIEFITDGPQVRFVNQAEKPVGLADGKFVGLGGR